VLAALPADRQEIVNVNWNQQILDDVTEHLVLNRPSFTPESTGILTRALAGTVPDALVESTTGDVARVAACVLPDEDDREAIAAARLATTSVRA